MNILHNVNINKKTDIPSLKFLFSLNYKTSWVFRGLDQLSSIIWRRVMAGVQYTPG